MPTFADIENEIKNVMEYIDELAYFDLSEERQEEINDYLYELGKAEAEKVDGFGFVIKALTDKAANYRDLAAQISAKARATEYAIERLKENYLTSMKVHDLKRIKGEVFSISRSTCSRVEADLDFLPEEFVKTTVTKAADKNALAGVLKSGMSVPGARLVQSEFISLR